MLTIPAEEPIFSYTHKLRSRYGETDKMGYVYYGRYLEYFEVARTEMIRAAGVSYSKMEEEGIMLPVIYAQVSYKSPVFYDEEMDIEVMVFKKPMIKLETFYRLTTNRSEKPHILGQVNLCFTDNKTRKPCKSPGYFVRLFEKLNE